MRGPDDHGVNAFVLHIREGKVDEYRRRHAEVWPELEAALESSGVVRYDLFLDAAGRRVFGYQLRRAEPDPGAPEHDAILRWRSFMADVLEMDGDRPRRTALDHVYHLAAEGKTKRAASPAPK